MWQFYYYFLSAPSSLFYQQLPVLSHVAPMRGPLLQVQFLNIKQAKKST